MIGHAFEKLKKSTTSGFPGLKPVVAQAFRTKKTFLNFAHRAFNAGSADVRQIPSATGR